MVQLGSSIIHISIVRKGEGDSIKPSLRPFSIPIPGGASSGEVKATAAQRRGFVDRGAVRVPPEKVSWYHR
jgi:hypothetical protein